MKITMNLPQVPIGISNRRNTNLHRGLGRMWMSFGSTVTAGLLLSASSTMADTPNNRSLSFTGDTVSTDVLPFAVRIQAVLSGTQIVYFDQNGALTRVLAALIAALSP